MINVQFENIEQLEHIIARAMIGEAVVRANVDTEWTRYYDAIDEYIVEELHDESASLNRWQELIEMKVKKLVGEL